MVAIIFNQISPSIRCLASIIMKIFILFPFLLFVSPINGLCGFCNFFCQQLNPPYVTVISIAEECNAKGAIYCQGDNKCYTTLIGSALNMIDASLSSFVPKFLFEGFPFWSNKTPECFTFYLRDSNDDSIYDGIATYNENCSALNVPYYFCSLKFLCYENFEKLRVVDFIKYTIIHSFKA
ncbi:hypothetical protein Anas_12520 [Armadillidium nasatum]|uniref:Uncharacterized protein n=1 Tax=Armadillidium nasatum TaxID=96803 RepID=A0A5N5TD98_9CRUS|nr:hypothetical protein Anas_12520 [Armadillidium nasatum]